MDAPCRELFIRGLRSVVALSVHWQVVFVCLHLWASYCVCWCVCALNVQSSCIQSIIINLFNQTHTFNTLVE